MKAMFVGRKDTITGAVFLPFYLILFAWNFFTCCTKCYIFRMPLCDIFFSFFSNQNVGGCTLLQVLHKPQQIVTADFRFYNSSQLPLSLYTTIHYGGNQSYGIVSMFVLCQVCSWDGTKHPSFQMTLCIQNVQKGMYPYTSGNSKQCEKHEKFGLQFYSIVIELGTRIHI